MEGSKHCKWCVPKCSRPARAVKIDSWSDGWKPIMSIAALVLMSCTVPSHHKQSKGSRKVRL
jgi:hypothetical protein